MRKALLWASTNAWMRERAMRTAFVRRSVVKFMPGERIEDAIEAAKAAEAARASTTILTRLGENITRIEEADEVRDHYLRVLDLDQGGRARRADLGQADAARLRPGSRASVSATASTLLARCEAAGNVLLARHGELAVRGRHDRAVQAAARAIADGRHRDSGVSLPDREGHRGARHARVARFAS